MVGNAKQADALTTTSAPFTDVSAQRWSAGYIAYCVQKGIIDGMGDGTFDPTGKVTGLQFAKMLLCAVGYGVNDEYVGDNWAINVAKDALNYDIFDGNLAGANNTPATREECALYAFNTTVNVKKVTYSALLGGYIENTAAWNAESNKSATIAQDYKLGCTGADDDDPFYLLEGHYWYVGKTSNRISDYYDADEYLLETYTTPVTGNELYNLLGTSIIKNCEIFEVYVDGEPDYTFGDEITSTSGKTKIEHGSWADDVVKSNTDPLANTGYGVRTYVYAIPVYVDGEFDHYDVRVCMINTYLAQVSSVKAATKTADAETKVTIACTALNAESKSFETTDFSKGDYVLITYSYREDEIQSMVAATTVESRIKSYTNNKGVARIGANGITYLGAEEDCMFKGQTSASDIDKEFVNGSKYTLFIDEYGYLIGIDDITVAKTFAYVAQFGYKFNTGSLTDTVALTADIYTSDGEHSVRFVDTGDETYFSDWENSAMYQNEQRYVDKLNAAIGTTNSRIGLYAVKENSNGTVTLTTLEDYAKEMNKQYEDEDEVAYGLDYTTEIPLSKVYRGVAGLRVVKRDNGYDLYSNSKTVFFYVQNADDYSNLKVSVYVGTSKAPTTTGDNQGLASWYAEAEDTNANAYAEAALVIGTPKNAESEAVDDTTYFYADNGVQDQPGNYTKIDNEDGTYTVTFVVEKNGETAEISFNFNSESAADTSIETAAEAADSWVIKGKDTLNALIPVGNTEKESKKDKLTYAAATVDEVEGDTLFYNSVFPAAYKDSDAHYMGVEVTGETLVIDLSHNRIDNLDDIAELLEDNTVEVAFAYDSDLQVTILYVVDVK